MVGEEDSEEVEAEVDVDVEVEASGAEGVEDSEGEVGEDSIKNSNSGHSKILSLYMYDY